MPKRLIFFILILCFYLGYTIVKPKAERDAVALEKNKTSMVHASPTGYKALYQTFEQIYSPERVLLWKHSPVHFDKDHPGTVWFIEPGQGLFMKSKTYGQSLNELVKSGYHFVFVMNPTFKVGSGSQDDPAEPVFRYLSQWFDIDMAFSRELDPFDNYVELQTVSHFRNRSVSMLAINPNEHEIMGDDSEGEVNEKKLNDLMKGAAGVTGLKGFGRECLLPDCQVKLKWVAHPVFPLVVHFPIGKGGVTLVSSQAFFNNSQLNRDENAALAIAIQEQFPNLKSIYFEGYSQGFRDSADFITILSRGAGRPLLISALLLIGLLCVWVATRPQGKILSRSISDERYYTQERFFDALSRHLLQSKAWGMLALRMAEQLLVRVGKRYPNADPIELLKPLVTQDRSPYAKEVMRMLELAKITTANPKAASPPTMAGASDFLNFARALFHLERKVLL